ncbi:MAG: cell division protein FtsZ [Pseudomonadota bacterium]|nr:cell division protein FtsZ [Pseudomonadota bacterium]
MINLSMADPEHNLRPRLTVIGVGGAGGNAINNMIRCNLEGCDFIGANTDSQALAMSLAPRKIQLGINLSRGLGAGSKPDMGRSAAEEQMADIMACLEGVDMLFVTAGMGGGTGTGAAPVIARAARESGILTVGVVTKPFHFEGGTRMRQAEAGIADLQQYVDTLIVIPNQNLFRIANERTTFAEAFRLADEVLHSGVRGITDLMVMPGFMNLDFADVKTVMGEMGKAMMGTGEADGDNRAVRAAEAAISNPLLDDVSMKGARGVLINITGGMDMTLFEVDQAANRIREEVDPEAQIKVGSTLGENLEGRIRVSVIATGIEAGIVSAQRSSAVSNGVGLRVPPVNPPRIVTAPPQSAPLQPQATPQAQPQSYFTMPQPVTPQVLMQQQQQQHQQHAPQQQAHQQQAYTQPLHQPVQPQAYNEPEEEQVHTAPPQAQHYEPVLQVQQIDPPMPQVAPPVPPSSRQMEPNQAPRQAYSPRPALPPHARPAPVQHQSAAESHAPFDMRVTQLTPPTHTASVSDQRRMRRSESLFTRITGFGLVRPSAQQDESEEMQLPDEALAEPQPLGINPADRPELSTENAGDRLEIPAFLRRQTNR